MKKIPETYMIELSKTMQNYIITKPLIVLLRSIWRLLDFNRKFMQQRKVKSSLGNLVDPASGRTLENEIKPCMCKLTVVDCG